MRAAQGGYLRDERVGNVHLRGDLAQLLVRLGDHLRAGLLVRYGGGGDSPKTATEEALSGDSVGCVEPLVHEEHVGVNGAGEAG
jgi:hypothetical protein